MQAGNGATCEAPRHGEVATFEAWTPSGQLLLRSRGEDVIAVPVAALESEILQVGDSLRWSRSTGIAYEKVETNESNSALC